MASVYEEPVFFRKNRVRRVYTGGKLFSSFFGDDSTDGYFPEEWIASTVRALNEGSENPDEGISVTESGELFSELVKKYKTEMLGQRDDTGVLVKFIDSAIRLPVQAHPDKGFSEKYFGSPYGKEESWIVLGTRPGAVVYYCFKKGVARAEFEKAIDSSENGGHMEDLLVPVPVKKGDVIYIPANTVHAIGAGCLILEVQEPTDYTIQPERWCGEYRLSDREMYLGLSREDALKVFDMEKTYPAPLERKLVYDKDGCKYEKLIDESITASFSLSVAELSGGELTLDTGCCVCVVIEGAGEIKGIDYCRKVKRGDYFFLPYAAKNKYTVSGSVQLALCHA